MKNKNLIFVTLLMSLFFVSFAMAGAPVPVIVTADNTEFNTLTPSISINNTQGNCTGYYVNITANNAIVVTKGSMLNMTSTAFTTSALTAGTSYIYNATLWNDTCMDSAFDNSTSDQTLEVNARPSVTTVTESTANNLLTGQTLTWTTTWADENSTGTDNVVVYVCKTDAFTTSCTGGEWGHSSSEADNSTTATYTILSSLAGGQKNYYVYLLDDNSYASSSSTSGTFTVSKPIEGETYLATTGVTAPEDDGKIPAGWIVVVLIIVVVGFFVFKKK